MYPGNLLGWTCRHPVMIAHYFYVLVFLARIDGKFQNTFKI